MILTDLIKEQAFQCLVMTAAGAMILIMYQVFRLVAALLHLPPVSEVFFWMAAAAVSYRFLYYCAFGQLSFHSATAFALGVLLWKIFFYDIIDKIYRRLLFKQGKCNKYGEKEKKQPIQREQSGN